MFSANQRISIFLLVLLAGTATAQIPGLSAIESASKDVAATEAPRQEVVDIADIPVLAEQDTQYLRDITQQLEGKSNVKALERDLNTIKRSVDALVLQTKGQQLKSLQLSGLESLNRHSRFLDWELKQWQKRQQAAAVPFASATQDLSLRHQRWAATRELSGEVLSPVLLSRMDELLASIKATQNAISRPLSQLILLSQQESAVSARIHLATMAVNDRIDEIDAKLLTLDSDNLFSVLSAKQELSAQGSKNYFQSLSQGFQLENAFMAEFDRSNQKKYRIYQILGALLLPLFLWVSYTARKLLKTGDSFSDYRTTLTRPFSAWLLLMVVGMLMIQLSGPLLRLTFLMLLAWIPVMRLQPEHVKRAFGRWVYLTAVFFFINLLCILFSQTPAIFRVLLLLNSISMMATAGWLLYRSASLVSHADSRHLPVLRGLLGCCIGVAAVALGSNIAGNVSLTAMLNDALVKTAYMALFLFAVRNVVSAFTRFIFRSYAEKLVTHIQTAGGIIPVLTRLFNVVLVLFWLFGTLTAFRIYRPLMEAVADIASFELGYGAFAISIGSIVLFAISVYLSFWVAKAIRGMLQEDILPNMDLPRGVANSVSTMSYYFLLIAGLMVALTAAGFKVSQLAIVIGALSVGIGFGLQTVVNNFVSGIILMLERPIQPGDTVELSGTVGRVRDIGMRATTLTTAEGADVVVPNGMLLAEKMINWTLSNTQRRIDIPVGVAYGTDPRRVLDILKGVANGTRGISSHPTPSVLFTGFGASSMDFSVRAWADTFDDSFEVRSTMAVNICNALKEAGIEIPFPQQDLHIRSVKPGLFNSQQGDSDEA